MQLSPAYLRALREQFDSLSEKDRITFAGAEAEKIGSNAVARALGCPASLVQEGTRAITTRAITTSTVRLESAFREVGCGDLQGFVKALGGGKRSPVTLVSLRQLGKHINSLRALGNRSPFWPTSVLRACNLARDTYQGLSGHLALEGARYLDLGCGNVQPFGTSAVMYLNGAREMVALDIDDTVPTRAAVSLYDILTDCVLFPDDWHWSSVSREEFLDRVRNFDLRALRDGDCAKGLGRVPLTHVVGDISAFEDSGQGFDAISSRVVLEHLMDFDGANRQIFNLLRPGGVACHKIDLGDHRKKRGGGHAFAFLADDPWNGDTNRLRSSEIRECFDRVGYQVERYDTRREPLPPGFHETMLPRFREMDRADVEVVEVTCVLRRPAAA